MKTILSLGASTGLSDAIVRFKSLGYRVLLAELPNMFVHAKCKAADEIFITDYTKPGFLTFADALRSVWEIEAAVSLTEYGVEVAALLNQKWEKRGSSVESIRSLNDKGRMRKLLADASFSPLRYRVIGSRDELEDTDIEFPWIVKPVNGAGSSNVSLAFTMTQARDAVTTVLATGATAIVEAYVDGHEYSVESFSFNGVHVIIAITKKVTDERFVEIGHVVPAPLDEKTEKGVKEFVTRFLEIIGVTNGACHTEMKIGSAGMRIIESHNRIGGGSITRLVYEAFGIDLVKMTAQWACGEIPPRVDFQAARGSASTAFFSFPSGVIESIQGVRQVQEHPDTVEFRCSYAVGDMVRPISGNSGRAGYVVVRGESSDVALETAQWLASKVIARVKPEPGPDHPISSRSDALVTNRPCR